MTQTATTASATSPPNMRTIQRTMTTSWPLEGEQSRELQGNRAFIERSRIAVATFCVDEKQVGQRCITKVDAGVGHEAAGLRVVLHEGAAEQSRRPCVTESR